MEKKRWFKAKYFGWGWYPCSWQGWVIVLMYVFALISNVIFINNHVNSNSDFLIQFVPQTYIMTVFLIIICYTTGEKPGWHWSFKKKDTVNIIEEDAPKKQD